MKIIYDDSTRSFSISSIITGPWGFKLGIPSDSDLARKIIPQVALTSYKYNFDSYHLADGADKSRMKEVYNKLLNMHPEVPVLEANGFNNACYINGLKNIIDNYDESERDTQIKLFAYSYGLDVDEFRSKLSNHMILMGKLFQSPQTLAHEFGHYQCTIGKGVNGGYEAHSKRYRSMVLEWLAELFYKAATIGALTFKDPKARRAAQLSMALSKLSKALVTKPILTSEMAASQTGMIDLKAAGATDEELKLYWDDLIQAYDTYRLHYRNKNLKQAMGGLILAGVDILRK